MVWIHNYHLFLLPSVLRTKATRAKIGIFIHTPFPSSDVFRMLPEARTILRGILGADLVGFHTFDFARHFLSSCRVLMNLEHETLEGGLMGLTYSGRRVAVLIRHVGIDAVAFR
jgi:trehalose 6-phosphate synthase/phosphatase